MVKVKYNIYLVIKKIRYGKCKKIIIILIKCIKKLN